MDMSELKDVLSDELAASVGGALAAPAGEIQIALEKHQKAVLAAEARIFKAQRKGQDALASINAEKERAAADYVATLERLERERAAVSEDMEREIATAEKLAAISRAALQAVQQ